MARPAGNIEIRTKYVMLMRCLCAEVRIFNTDDINNRLMLIREAPLSHFINHYFGYGSWDARIWFIGYEEGGGDLPEEVAEKLEYFYQEHRSADSATLCDIRNVYRHVAFQ